MYLTVKECGSPPVVLCTAAAPVRSCPCPFPCPWPCPEVVGPMGRACECIHGIGLACAVQVGMESPRPRGGRTEASLPAIIIDEGAGCKSGSRARSRSVDPAERAPASRSSEARGPAPGPLLLSSGRYYPPPPVNSGAMPYPSPRPTASQPSPRPRSSRTDPNLTPRELDGSLPAQQPQLVGARPEPAPRPQSPSSEHYQSSRHDRPSTART